MIRPAQLRDDVIRPVLASLAPLQADQMGQAQENVVELLLGTAMQESHCGDYLAQRGGPALGVWQMEPATEKDCWSNFLNSRPALSVPVARLVVQGIDRTLQLAGNLYYACAMARVRYMRSQDPLPATGDINAQAAYYLKNYNAGGRATIDEYLENWHTLQAIIAKGAQNG
ncbi:MAG: hypothetical protein ACLPKW_14820 [Acetobacteraceae bacterium]